MPWSGSGLTEPPRRLCPSDWRSESLWTQAFCSRAWKALVGEPLAVRTENWCWGGGPCHLARTGGGGPRWGSDPRAEQASLARPGRGPRDLAHVPAHSGLALCPPPRGALLSVSHVTAFVLLHVLVPSLSSSGTRLPPFSTVCLFILLPARTCTEGLSLSPMQSLSSPV